MATTISTDRDLIILVNVFDVAPDDQQRLIDLLVRATEEVMRTLPGYISANIHRSFDGTRVVNYAQWRSREAFEQMLGNDAARSHMDAARQIATADPRLFEVVYTDAAG
jgi:quinol monooxygenase YgiN